MTAPTAPGAPPPGAPPQGAPPAPAPAAVVGTARPTFDPATFRQTVIVAAALATIFFGSQLLNEALPAFAEDAPGRPVRIGDGATITPLEDWVSSELENGLRLEKGTVVVDLFPQEAADAGALATLYLNEVLRAQATQLTPSEPGTVTSDSGSAARFTYQGIFTGVAGAIEGEVTAFVTGGDGVLADAWAPQGRLGVALAEVHAMLDTIEVAE